MTDTDDTSLIKHHIENQNITLFYKTCYSSGLVDKQSLRHSRSVDIISVETGDFEESRYNSMSMQTAISHKGPSVWGLDSLTLKTLL